MKIAVWHNLPSGGGKRALYYHVKGLVQRGHSVESWCPSSADQQYLPLGDLIKENIKPIDWKSISVESSFYKRLSWVFFDMYHNIDMLDKHCRQCADEINNSGFDLLFANTSISMAVAPIAKYVKLPKILYLQEPTRMLYEAMPKWPWIPPDFPHNFWKSPASLFDYIREHIRLRYFQSLAREEWHNINVYDAVLVNSFYSRESILKAYGVNARVCYLGIDTDLFSVRHKQRGNFILGVGSFNPSKNIEFIIKSLARVDDPRPRLIWIGNYSVPQYLEDMKQLAVSHQVDFEAKEMITDDELVDLLNKAIMMTYAPRLEPFGFAPLEANACGLPVVAVAEGGIRETIIDGINGLLVNPDEHSLAQAIEQLRDNKELAYTLGQNGRKLIVEKWSLNSAIDRIEQQLSKVIKPL